MCLTCGSGVGDGAVPRVVLPRAEPVPPCRSLEAALLARLLLAVVMACQAYAQRPPTHTHA